MAFVASTAWFSRRRQLIMILNLRFFAQIRRPASRRFLRSGDFQSLFFE
jgi:hypothetical protein